MERSLLHSSPYDQQYVSHEKRTRNPRTSSQTHFPLIPLRTNSFDLYFENFPKMEMMVNPQYPLIPFSSSSSSSSLPRLKSSPYPLRFHQPPLLPLPMASSSFSSTRQSNKMKPSKKAPSPQKSTKTKKYPDVKPDLGPNGNTKRWVSNPERQLFKNAKRVTFGKDTTFVSTTTNTCVPKDETKFSKLVFAMSPPPSSLPIPKFSILMKPKLSCKAVN